MVPGAIDADATYDSVLMVLDMGGEERHVIIQLNEAAAPQHCANFKKLVEEGFYNGLAFHRVIPGYLIQTGDPLSQNDDQKLMWGTGGPGYTVPAEINLPHQRGALSMARLGDDVNPERASNGSQFYLSLSKNSRLNGKYTVFGQVTQGLGLLSDMAKVGTDANDVPLKRIEVKFMRMVRRNAQFTPRKTTKPVKSSKPESQKGGFDRLMERFW
jgi:cyclophilin family peptidyl-prolyl cis-trans isomerase